MQGHTDIILYSLCVELVMMYLLDGVILHIKQENYI